MITLEIHFNSAQEVELCLSGEEGIIDSFIFWPIEPSLVDKGGIDFHFDTVLVTAVDKILKRNRIQELSLDRVLVTGKYEQSSVSYFVAEAVASALKIK